MAIWQFGFYLVPYKGIVVNHTIIPQFLEQYKPRHQNDDLDFDKEFINYWEEVEFPQECLESISLLMPRVDHWDEDALMFGEKTGNCVEIWEDDLICSIDANNPSEELIYLMVDIAKKLEYMIILKENGKVIQADYDELIKSYRTSKAVKFINNPKDTLKKFKKSRLKLIKNRKGSDPFKG